MPIESLRIGRQEAQAVTANHDLYQARLTPSRSRYPMRNVGRNQLLDGSMSLSLLYRRQTRKFARYHRVEPPPSFRLALPCAGIAHHLSGGIRCAPTQPGRARPQPRRPTVPLPLKERFPPCILSLRPSPCSGSGLHTSCAPWSVFQDGSKRVGGLQWQKHRRGDGTPASARRTAPRSLLAPHKEGRPRLPARAAPPPPHALHASLVASVQHAA